MLFMVHLKFDFPRMRVMAMVWHSPYAGKQLFLDAQNYHLKAAIGAISNPWNVTIDEYEDIHQ